MTLHVDPDHIDIDLTAPDLDGARCLCRFEDGDAFAYLERGSEFIRISDHEVWAVEREDTLLSARSGEALAYRRGKVFFSVENDEPLYYERAI